MRLIDADLFKLQFRADTVTGTTIHRAIDEQPTIYDADKIIDKLQEMISSYELSAKTASKEIEGKCENEMTFEICSLHNSRGYLNGLRKALEIVKSGGVADE